MTPPIWDHGMGMFDMKVETNQSNLVVSYGCFQLTNLDAHRSMDPPIFDGGFPLSKNWENAPENSGSLKASPASS